MTLEEVIKIRGVLFKHKDCAVDVQFSTKYKIAKFLIDTDPEAKFCEEMLLSIKQQDCENENEKIQDLLRTETDKKISFKPAELVGFNFSVDDLICIYEAIEEDGT